MLGFILGFFLDFLSLFLDIGEGKVNERERNINVWLPLAHPPLGTQPIAKHVPLSRIKPATPWLAGWCSVPEPYQPGLGFYLFLFFYF